MQGIMRWAAVICVAQLPVVAGCMHRTTISQDFGLAGGNPSEAASPKVPSATPQDARQASGSTPFRVVPLKQVQGATDALAEDGPIAALKARLSHNPEDIAARLELGGIYESYHLYDDGLAQFTQALHQAFATAGTGGSVIVQAVRGLGRCARASGRTPQAISELRASLKMWPSEETWDELGLTLAWSNDPEGAELAFREAIARDAGSYRLHNNLGYSLLLQSKTGEAECELRKALELNPKSAASRNNLATILARKGDRSGALEQFQLASDAATAHNNLAVVLLESGKPDQGRQELIKALTLRPYFAPALANLKLAQEQIPQRTGASASEPRKNGSSDAYVPSSAKREGEKSKTPGEKK